MSRSSSGAGGLAEMVGASVLRTSVKCSAHRLACICSVVSAFPSLSLTMLAATLVCLKSCFVILYTEISSPFCAVVSAFSASLSMQALLSCRALLFISLSLLLYSFCKRSCILSDFVLRILDLMVFLSSILLQVSLVSQVLSVLFRYPRVLSAVVQ